MKKSEELKREKYWADDLILPPECDFLCWFRSCYKKGEDKGSFTQGVGYTKYHDNFIPCCMTRLLHGCGAPWKDSVNMSLALTWCLSKLKENTKEKNIAMRVLELLAASLQKHEEVKK